jgi:hypothetical protein
MDQPQPVLRDHMLDASSTPPLASKRATGGGLRMPQKKTMMMALGVIIVLVVIIAVVVWRKRNYSKPDCSKYSGEMSRVCQDVSKVCGGDAKCLNATAHCMPIVDRVASAGDDAALKLRAVASFSGGQLSQCTKSMARIDPRWMAGQLHAASSDACLPPAVALGVQAIPAETVTATYAEAVRFAQAAQPLVGWGVQVAKNLPTCPTPPSTPPP